jgi:hypothetical protein
MEKYLEAGVPKSQERVKWKKKIFVFNNKICTVDDNTISLISFYP